jgi:hypothetical protein
LQPNSDNDKTVTPLSWTHIFQKLQFFTEPLFRKCCSCSSFIAVYVTILKRISRRNDSAVLIWLSYIRI